MGICIDRPHGIPRWVGARTHFYRTMTQSGMSDLKTKTVFPPVRGRLYKMLRQIMRKG